MSAPAEMRGLLDSLAADGESEAKLILERAREEATALVRDAIARRRAALDRRIVGRGQEIALREAAVRLEARSDARRSALFARRAIVNRVMDAARAMLPAAASEDWLRSAAEEALEYLPEGEVVVRCAGRDVALMKKFVAGRRAARVVADDKIGAGVVAESPDGSVRVDGTLDSRLGRLHAEIAIAVVSSLEGAA